MQAALQRYGGAKGYTPQQFYALMSEVAAADLAGFFAKAVESTDELDYTEALDYYGLRFKPLDPRTARAFLGATTRADNGRLVISGVRRGTPAFDAGLNTDDEILAVDGVRVRADGLTARLEQYRPGDRVQVLVARRDRLTPVDVTLAADPGRPWRLEMRPDVTDEQKDHLSKWLGQ
jgi:predicted metalloprotease with PDZ domain